MVRQIPGTEGLDDDALWYKDAVIYELHGRIELIKALLFSLPGTPVIYYGDEIGMGGNIYLGDRNGVHTPMQWNVDRNAGFSRSNPQRLYLPVIIDPEYHYEAVNVESQQNNPPSLLWWMKRLIALRRQSLALASEKDDPEFAPEPFSDSYRQSLYDGILAMANRSLHLLREQLATLPPHAQADARDVLAQESAIRARLRGICDLRINTAPIRHHGDYHLGQVLCTGKDILIIDFEGEPGRPPSERRIKRSPLRDVAGMLRSYHYASQAALLGQVSGIVPRPANLPALYSWADLWYRWACTEFLKGYLETAGRAPFLPTSREELRVLLDALVLEKATYELGYELNHRPDWVRIPLLGILSLLREQALTDIPGSRKQP